MNIARIIVTIAGLVTAGLLAAWIVAGQLVAPVPKLMSSPPNDLPVQPFSLVSKSGSTIAGWHIPASGNNGVIVLLHGIWGSRFSMLERARMLYAEGYTVLMIDLQAHGESPGKHITLGYLERHDVRATVDYAKQLYPDRAIGVLGVSLGGAAAVIASPLGVQALVLESVFPHIDAAVHNRVAARLGIFSWLPAELLLVQLQPRLGISTQQLRPIDRIRAVESPIFLMSGQADRHTRPAETRAMFEAALEPKQLWLVDDAGHQDLLGASPLTYREKVVGFFDRYLRGRSDQ